MATAPRSLPSGRVTFAFVDVVGSTRTFHEHGEAYVAAQRALHTRVAEHAARSGGVVVTTEGDGAFLAFSDAPSAVSALVALQDELEAARGEGLQLRLRCGAHTGDAVPVDGNYLAVAVHVAARVAATANAGQVLVTDAVAEALDSSVGEPAIEVGTYSLKDLPEPTRIWRVAGDPTPPRATPARRTNVRAARTSFVGRTDELDRLGELVGTPGLVSVVGPGGSGKTRLVSELALGGHASLPGGAWMVELAPLESPDQVVASTGAAVGLASTDLDEIVEVLRLRERCVLVLDNCEHLLEGVCALVETLLDACPELTLLCTSREALQLPGERAWTLPPLPVDGPATQLFLERATDSAVAAPDLDLVFKLCAALDGLPLAIELAASQVRAAPLQEILEAVTAGSDALERRGGEARQRSLDAVLEWSLARLTPQARDSLLIVSVFPGRFTPEMARAVLNAAPHGEPEAIKVLARASLVDIDGTDYRLLSTVRDAARRQLGEDPALAREARDALADWAATYGEERYRILTAHEDVTDDALLAIEAALDHALEVGTSGVGRAWHLLAVISNTRGAGAPARALSARAVRIAPSDLDSVFALAAGVSILEHHQEDSGVSMQTFQAMKAVARDAEDFRLLTDVLHGEALRDGHLGRWTRSLSLWHDALVLTGTHDEARHQLPVVLSNLGYAYYYSGDRANAIEYYQRAMEAATEQGLWHLRAAAHLHLADTALIEDRRTHARDHALSALQHSPPSFTLRGSALAMLARALTRLGDRETALATGREAVELLGQRSSPAGEEELQTLLAELPELRS